VHIVAVTQAPDGQTFYSYAKAQEHWQALGETPLRQPFSDISKSSRRVARLPPGWEVKATHRDVGKRQGQVRTLHAFNWSAAHETMVRRCRTITSCSRMLRFHEGVLASGIQPDFESHTSAMLRLL